MINREQQIDRETLSKRNALKNVYRTQEGKYELARTLRECGVFDQISCEPGAVELRNFGIRKMEDLGLLDEESLVDLIDWMLSHEWKNPVD
ncbi:hypothetical protein [Pleomorphochaeta sp. DL1XJH-081]|uniref:hypothetical protein n=1 Tax=Pleomorphochaeta sp. DL1XJH-081 TaxID=3409690 RepID=UPI003BB4C9F0